MPAPHPQEFRDDAVALARKGDAPVSKIAKDLSSYSFEEYTRVKHVMASLG